MAVDENEIENKEEIVVTEAMIEAGVNEFLDWTEDDHPRGVVMGVYFAMAQA